jgi:transposase
VSRRVWRPEGERPVSCGRTRYEWLYVFGFAHPASGRSLQPILPRVDTGVMSVALAEFARWADPEGRKTLAVLLDNAGWHVSKGLVVPPNVVLHRVPPHTPEPQPVESLWPLVREGIADRTFDTLDELEERLSERCRYLMGHPEVVRGRVGRSWAAGPG